MWYWSMKSWKKFLHVFCNNCLEFWRLGFFLFFVLFCFGFGFWFWFFVLFFFLFLFYFFFLFLEVKTWKVKCYSLPFFLLSICDGKNLHKIEHTKRIKQSQDCQEVIVKKSLRIYICIYLFLYHLCFLSLWSARFLQSWKCVVKRYKIMKNISLCLL